MTPITKNVHYAVHCNVIKSQSFYDGFHITFSLVNLTFSMIYMTLLAGLTFCVIHFCVIHPDFQQTCTHVMCHTQSHRLCHTLFYSEFFCHTPPRQPIFLSYFIILLLVVFEDFLLTIHILLLIWALHFIARILSMKLYKGLSTLDKLLEYIFLKNECMKKM